MTALRFFVWTLVVLTLAGLLSGCNAGDGRDTATYEVTGHIGDLEDGRAVLMKLDLDTNEPSMVDTVAVRNGRFTFRGILDHPYLHTIKFVDDENQRIHFFLENSAIAIEGVSGQLEGAEVSGSREDGLFRAYEMGEIFDRDVGVEIMFDHPDYVFSAFVAYYQFQTHTFSPDTMTAIMEGFTEPVKASVYYQHLERLHESLMRVAVGSQAPAFSLPDRQGTSVSLAEFTGQYVLLDFWASWCPPCRAENPKLLDLYNGFQARGFEIIGISVDTDRAKWVRAIEQDGVDWVHLSQLDGWGEITTLYGVKAVPQNFLIDPQGIIIGRNVDAAHLAIMLEEILPE